MSRYRRARIEGGAFFFTLALANRSSDVLVRDHALWLLPEGDADFASRWSLFKSGFSRGLPAARSRSNSKIAKREKGIWQRRYWEHTIRDDADFERHVDYIHYNPVKHGLVSCVRDWPYSSFHGYVEGGILPADWGGDMMDMPGRFGE